LQSIAPFEPLRLVGGTALALHFGHRDSIDLDLFGNHALTNEELLHILVENDFDVIEKYTTKNIYACTCNEIKVDIVNYDIDWSHAPIVEDGIKLASLEDITAMKLKAIAGRGSKKDFVDIYFLLRHFSLNKMLELFQKKYPNIATLLVVKSLAYFVDADTQPMPNMYIPTQWETVQETILNAIREL
jgi:predicted nucleotidyltransferase component of viral defense system